MSGKTLRRYRAERLLREDFERLRERVLGGVRARLAASGVVLDGSDLEACYAQAWQGLYATMLAGERVANPAGWLALATFRRAIDEHRARARFPLQGVVEDRDGGRHGAVELDLASDLDDRRRLRELMEGLRMRLSDREREAAALCYLQGLSRSEAAARMGLSTTAMRKLMEGRSPERPGVAAKVGELAATISDGSWCEEQASLMRALAFGVLAPGGDRHRLALVHQRECPACRSYVAALRGVAVALPPALSPLALGVAITGSAGPAAGGAIPGSAAGAPAAAAHASGGVAGAGAGSAAGAGGGWLVAGPLGAKLATGCLIVLGMGAGCAALVHGSDRRRVPPAGRIARPPARAGADGADVVLAAGPRGRGVSSAHSSAPGAAPLAPAPAGPSQTGPAGAPAAREFTPEQASATAAAGGRPAPAEAARSGVAGGQGAAQEAQPAPAAAREFGPG